VSFTAGYRTQSDCSAIQADPYSIAFVQSALRFLEDSAMRGSFGGEQTQYMYGTPSLPQLGDDVSIAIVKTLDAQELAKPETAYRYLELVALAFSDQNKIVREADKDPRVTMFVLDYLQQRESSEPKLEKRIDTIRVCVRNYTCNVTSRDGSH